MSPYYGLVCTFLFAFAMNAQYLRYDNDAMVRHVYIYIDGCVRYTDIGKIEFLLPLVGYDAIFYGRFLCNESTVC